ncbi:MAG: metallophosphoesterase family protein [Desulfosarcinaceae bacterium]|nr:metallophosphoesterase family protein [Desulfosarcinaceae bacterium]
MRIAVISDIHGNMDAFDQVTAELRDIGVDETICLGDCVGYGAESEKVVAAIHDLEVPVVMGNHELAMVHPNQLKWFNPLAQTSLAMTRSALSPESLAIIASWPRFVSKHGARFVHGFPPDRAKMYLFQAREDHFRRAFAACEERLCFVGHTHELELVVFDGDTVERMPLAAPVSLKPHCRYIVNVGSVGQPRDGGKRAKYILWDTLEDSLMVGRVAYDNERAAQKIRQAGLPEAHARKLL